MTKSTNGAVLVGIDGSLAGARALTWAAEEAQRRSCDLVVAHAGHVLQTDAISATTARSVLQDLCDFGKELLSDAVATVAEIAPGVEVRTVLEDSHPAQLLIDLSEGAGLVVVGRSDESALSRFVFGSVTKHLADRSHCPVVVVSGAAEPQKQGRVVVGVSESASGMLALDFACREATMRGTGVLAVRSASEFPWALGSLASADATSLDAVQSGERAVLQLCVTHARDRFPGLTIDAELTYTSAETYLANLTDAALIVVGCRRSGSAHLPRLGPLTSWLVQHSICPVAVVGQTIDTGAESASSAGIPADAVR